MAAKKPPPPPPKPKAAPPPPRPKPAPPKPAPAKPAARPVAAAKPAPAAKAKVVAKPAAKAAAKPKAKAAAKPPARGRPPAAVKAKAAAKPKAKAAAHTTKAKPAKPPKAKAKGDRKPKAKPKGTKPAKKGKGKPKRNTDQHGPRLDESFTSDAVNVNSEQAANINTVLRVGYQNQAPELALLAMLDLGFGENSWVTLGCNSSDHCGVFQLSSGLQAEHPYTDVEYWARRAYLDGFYSYGGIIPIARAHPDYSPGRITNMCQGAYSDLTEGANYYDQYGADAEAALNQFGPDARKGIKYKPGTTPTSSAPNTTTETSLKEQIHGLDWAGGVENVIKAILGGSNQAAHMATTYSTGIQKLAYVQPTKKGKK